MTLDLTLSDTEATTITLDTAFDEVTLSVRPVRASSVLDEVELTWTRTGMTYRAVRVWLVYGPDQTLLGRLVKNITVTRSGGQLWVAEYWNASDQDWYIAEWNCRRPLRGLHQIINGTFAGISLRRAIASARAREATPTPDITCDTYDAANTDTADTADSEQYGELALFGTALRVDERAGAFRLDLVV